MPMQVTVAFCIPSNYTNFFYMESYAWIENRLMVAFSVVLPENSGKIKDALKLLVRQLKLSTMFSRCLA